MGIRLIVGLGNPGPQYAQNRHNIGFMVLDELAQRSGGTWQQRPNYLLCEFRVAAGKLWLLKPNTFMNLSGSAVQPFMRYHKLLPGNLLVVQDDLDLPFGRLRFRLGGSSGGQNGLQDISEKLASQNFARLKIGISRPPENWQVSNWVLSNFSAEELPMLLKIIATASDAAKQAVQVGLGPAQNKFNPTDLREKQNPESKPNKFNPEIPPQTD